MSTDISKKEKLINFTKNSTSKAKECGKKFMQKKHSKKIIIIAAILVLILVFALVSALKGDDKKTQGQNTATVTRGNVTKIIEGSGTIEAIDQYEVTSVGIKGEILECTFEEGDEVKKDQVLYVIDSSDMESSINRAKLSVEKAQTSYDEAVESYNDMYVYATSSGVITELNVSEGSKVNNGMSIATIKDDSKMMLSIAFNDNDAAFIHKGDTAEVSLENSYTTIYGTVTHVGTGTTISDEGASIKMVEITVDNPGAIKDGDRATAIVGNVACNSIGTFKSNQEKNVEAKLSGDVISLNYKLGDYINKGDLLLQIDSDNSESSLKNAKNNLADAQENLNNLYDEMEEYSIKAPIDGKIVQKNYKAGEKIDNSSNSSSPLAIISDLSILTFDINIDELDIASIKVGQEVDITADAYENERFSGVVDKISVVGTSSNGVTTYPITVIVNSENKDLLIPGMNVSASIVIEEAENVLRIPVSALRRGNVVIAKTSSDGAKSTANGNKASNGENMQMPNGDVKQMPNGDMQMPNGDGKQMPNGDMQMPSGENKGNQNNQNNQNSQNNQNGDSKNNGNKNSEMSNEDNPFLRNLEIPAGYKAVFVEVGLSDDSFVEIKSGLNEGDIVILPDTTLSTDASNMMGGMMGGMGGMPAGGGMPTGGGMPAGGGMPSGGNQGGNRQSR